MNFNLPDDANAEQAGQWLRQLVRDFGIGFHPDTPASEYVNRQGRPINPDDANALQASIDRLFEILGSVAPYRICLDEAHRMVSAESASDIKTRIRHHPMYSTSDLRYLRQKGYSDEEILAFWNRDHAQGKSPCHHRVKISFEGIELPSPSETIQHANADPEMDTAITLHGKHYAVPKRTAEHLESQGIAFAYLHDYEMPDGTHRIMTVPVND